MRTLSCAALLALLTIPAPGARGAALVAERITEGNAAAYVLGGVDAIGGIGDWALRNGTLCAVISDPSHQSNLSTNGGGLIDLGYCGRADDQFLLLQPLLNNSLATPAIHDTVHGEIDGERARIVVRGERDGVAVESRYELDRAQPARLRITSRVARAAPGMRVFGFASALANVRSLSPFSFSTHNPGIARGFIHPGFRGRGLGALGTAASPVEMIVAVGAEPLDPGIAYGQRVVGAWLEQGSGERIELPRFFLADGLATTLATFARPFWIGDGASLGWLQLLQTRFMDLEDGERLVLEQEIWVGDRADVASVTDLLFADAPRVVGRADDPSTVIHVDRADGAPFTEARTRADGRFALRLPAGSYRLRARADGGRELQIDFVQEGGGTDLGTLAVGAPGRVRLPRGPVRLVFVGEDGTPTPNFDDDRRGFVVTGEGEGWTMPTRNDLHLAGIAMDPEEVTLAPGTYRVWATLGPEFSLGETRIEVRPGETIDLDVPMPTRELDTPGWISSDFHVHAGHSLDTPLRPDTRVASFVAQGGEVLVSSDHDAVYDYAPLIAKLGLGDRLTSLVGLEITSEVPTELAPHTIGHANTFPMPYRPLDYRRGAVDDEGRRWREIIAELRSLPGERVIQLNHSRFDEPGIQRRAFFSHMGPAATPYDPTRPLDEAPNDVLAERDPRTGLRDIDFDAMELLNGPHMKAYARNRTDWFSLLCQGERLTGTANSDSHFLRAVVAAPRSYVRVDGDRVAAFNPGAFVRSVLEGRIFGTTGPILEVRLDDAGPGDTLRAAGGTLEASVRAASWVDVSELRVFVNGEQVHTAPVEPGATVRVPLRFERDAFVTVEVEGEPGEGYGAVLSRFVPFAFTNPIRVDSDSDGTWTPPGLESGRCRSAAAIASAP